MVVDYVCVRVSVVIAIAAHSVLIVFLNCRELIGADILELDVNDVGMVER
jgi:hypothetical protein